MTIRVLLVDDHPIVRAGIAGMIASTEGIEVVGESANGQEALALLQRTPADVILLDLRMPVMDGPMFIRTLRD